MQFCVFKDRTAAKSGTDIDLLSLFELGLPRMTHWETSCLHLICGPPLLNIAIKNRQGW